MLFKYDATGQYKTRQNKTEEAKTTFFFLYTFVHPECKERIKFTKETKCQLKILKFF